MAPPPFSKYSPDAPEGGGGPAAAPVFGAGPGDDPGYLASLRGRTELGRMRLLMLVLAAAPVLVLAITPLIVAGGPDDPALWPFAPLVAAAAAAALAGPRTPRPMAPEDDQGRSAATALALFRQALLSRFALAEAVIVLGLPLSIAGKSELVFAAGFVLGYPLLLWLALPTRGGVERLRRRLESRGAESHLWAALLAEPVPHDYVPHDAAD
ncbi:hypothetical protein ACFOY4_07940 [Actinomadura syzygii]|uniref:Uncharacterized protein n=1 Tax=Actinomadura syzygii TaxID=1427538 RepID=A0A5D0UGP0_9ACTN|nr:hypothetical protein [Actinomadura syzygii]TYC16753.1 hypothetical protein FXF65_09350 [Actinomadura syzygii]